MLYSRRAGVFPDKLRLFQTSWVKIKPILLTVNLSFYIFQMSWPLSIWVGTVADELGKEPLNKIVHVHVLILYDFKCKYNDFLLAVFNSCPCLFALTGKVKLIDLFIHLFQLSFNSFSWWGTAGPDVQLLRQHTTFSMCMIIKAMHAVVIIMQ